MANLWLAYKVPVSPQDLAWASWAGSYVTATSPNGAFSRIFALTLLAMGFGITASKKSALPAISVSFLALVLCFAGNESAQLRIGIADGTIKVGCYSYGSKECRTMLEVPVNGAPSLYRPGGDVGEYATWYSTSVHRPFTLGSFVPGGYFIRSPLYIFKAGEINLTLSHQRQEVQQFRQANGLAN